MFQHLVNDTVFLGLLGRQERVHFDVLADLLDVTTGMLGQRVLQPFTHTQHLLGLDFNLRGLAEALVDGRLRRYAAEVFCALPPKRAGICE